MRPKIAAVGIALLFLVQMIPNNEAIDPTPPPTVFRLFGTGSMEYQCDLSAGGTANANLSIQTGMIIDECRMAISSGPHTANGTDYPRNVSIDVGNNNKTEWAFKGTGYGNFGCQNEFSNDSSGIIFNLSQNNTNSTSILLPQSVSVSSAICSINADPPTEIVSILDGNWATGSPFQDNPSFSMRYQWLLHSDEIGRSGVIENFYLRLEGIGTPTFYDFRMRFCHTPLTNLTNNFTQNYGGNTPVQVINTSAYTAECDMNSMLLFDVNDTFKYSNNKNLIIEMAYTSRSNIYFAYWGKLLDIENKRALKSTNNDTSEVGSTWGGFRTDFTFDFNTTFNFTVDVGSDNATEFQNNTTPFPGVEMTFTQVLNDYLSNASINLTDDFGNKFSSVPISVWAQDGATVRLSNLSIIYNYTAKIFLNPTNGNLTNELNDVLPDTPGPNNVSIPIIITSESAGKIRLSNLSIRAHPPDHDPVILQSSPSRTISIPENSSIQFSVKCTDYYGFPMTYKWFHDEILQPAETTSRLDYLADFESAGLHRFDIEIENGVGKETFSWNLTVTNVNRPPIINSSIPEDDPQIRENESIDFSVNATDADGDPLSYQWFLNGGEIPGLDAPAYKFSSDYSSAGTALVEVQIRDPEEAMASREWRLTILNQNLPPVINTWSPPDNLAINETEAMAFSVAARDPDGQQPAYKWFLDGAGIATGQDYTYTSSFNSSGNHTIRVVVSDGELAVFRQWILTVLDVNRPPVAKIDSPSGVKDFLDTQEVSFSANSSFDPDGDGLAFNWTENGLVLATRPGFTMRFSPGTHNITLVVQDGAGGRNTAVVQLSIHYFDLRYDIALENGTYAENDELKIGVQIRNAGDADSGPVKLTLLIDGKMVLERDKSPIGAGRTEKDSLSWKAQKGSHTLTVLAGNQTWSRTVNIQAQKEIIGLGDSSWLVLVPILVVAVILATILVKRRK